MIAFLIALAIFLLAVLVVIVSDRQKNKTKNNPFSSEKDER
ncbi:hypothetical protein [Roseimarinus sediminis]